MKDKKHIKQLINDIAKKDNLGSIEQWKTTQYEILKENIQEKTGEIISDRTIRRLVNNAFFDKNDISPRLYTLNILTQYLCNKDWLEYLKDLESNKNDVKEENISTNKKKSNFKTIVYAVTFLILGILFIIFLITSSTKTSIDLSKIKVKINQNILPYPNAFKFSYEIPNEIKDSIFLEIACLNCLYDQQDKQFGYLIPEDTSILMRVKEPMAYTVWLTDKRQKIEIGKIYTSSNQWLYGFYNHVDHDSIYMPLKPNHDSTFRIDQNNINNLKKSEHYRGKTILSNIFKGEFDLKNTIIETRLKNLYFKDLSCNLFKFYIHGSKGTASVLLSANNCRSKTEIKIPGILYKNKVKDNPIFVREFNEWTNIKFKFNPSKFKVILDNKDSLQLEMNKELGECRGFTYWFLEGCEIDHLTCTSLQGDTLWAKSFGSSL